jgi:hypothetical protein
VEKHLVTTEKRRLDRAEAIMAAQRRLTLAGKAPEGIAVQDLTRAEYIRTRFQEADDAWVLRAVLAFLRQRRTVAQVATLALLSPDEVRAIAAEHGIPVAAPTPDEEAVDERLRRDVELEAENARLKAELAKYRRLEGRGLATRQD